MNVLLYLLLCIAQCVIGVSIFLSPYVMLNILPLLILAIPMRRSTIPLMIIAFVTGFAVDFFTDGVLGLSSAALLCTALLKKPIIGFFGGEEASLRKDFTPFARFTTGRSAVCIAVGSFIFFCVYVWLDGAAMRPVWFNAARICASTAASTLLGVVICRFLLFNSDQKWK